MKTSLRLCVLALATVAAISLVAAEEEATFGNRRMLQQTPWLRIPVYGQPNWLRVTSRLLEQAASLISYGPVGDYVGPFAGSALTGLTTGLTGLGAGSLR